MGGHNEARGVIRSLTRGVISHDELSLAGRVDRVAPGAIGQYLGWLERRAIRGHNLTGSC